MSSLSRTICICHNGVIWGFSSSSAGKESVCNGADPNSIPGSRRSPREGIGYPLQYSWADKESQLVSQQIKNPPAMQNTWVQSLGWEDPLKEGMATHSNIIAWRIPMGRGAWQATVHGVSELDMTERLSIHSVILEGELEILGKLFCFSKCHTSSYKNIRWLTQCCYILKRGL